MYQANQFPGKCVGCGAWVPKMAGKTDPPERRGWPWRTTCAACMTPAEREEQQRRKRPPTGPIVRSKYNLAARAACPARHCGEHLDCRTGLRHCIARNCPMPSTHFEPNARQDAERGRPLTAKEKLENLARSLGKPDDYFTRRKFDEPE